MDTNRSAGTAQRCLSTQQVNHVIPDHPGVVLRGSTRRSTIYVHVRVGEVVDHCRSLASVSVAHLCMEQPERYQNKPANNGLNIKHCINTPSNLAVREW